MPLRFVLAFHLTTDDVSVWLSTHGSRLLGILIAVLIARLAIKHVVPPAVRRMVFSTESAAEPREREKRATTLANVLVQLSIWGVLIIGGFLALSEVGYNLAPVIAGLGIGGVAIGLGAQSLVKDTINGLLILGEGQYGYGDWVTLAGVSGMVEDVNLRRTVLRDLDGTVHTIPNSAVVVASNQTRDYSGINVTVLIPHAASLEKALAVATRVGRELQEDAELGADVIDPPRPTRIEGIDEKGVTLRILGKARSGKAGALAFEFRRRLVEAYDAEGLRYTVSSPAAPGARPVPPSAQP